MSTLKPAFLKSAKRISFRRSVPRLYAQAIFALAAALALTNSACGKNDGSGGAVPAKTTTAPAVTDTSTVGVVAGTGSVAAAKPKTDVDAGSGKSAKTTSKRGEGSGAEGVANRLEERPRTLDSLFEGEPDPGAPVKPAVVRAPEPLQVASVIFHDKQGLTADQIFSGNAEVDASGALIDAVVRSDIDSRGGEALYYTGAGHDTLREHLTLLVKENARTLDEKTIAGDRELAQTIQLSGFKVDWPSRRAELNFKLERRGSQGVVVPSRVHMEGPLDSLTRFKVGDLKRAPFIEAEVACMDISGGCLTVHIKVQDNSTGCIRIAHMIARQTNATLYIEGNSPGVAKNAEYDRLMTLLLNTVHHPRGENVVEKLTLTTSETIGGASNFSVTMKVRLMDQYGRRGGDTFEVSGPLAKPLSTSYMNVGVNVAPALTVINGEIVPTSAIGTQGRIVDTVREGRLVRNDGRGNLQLDLTVRSATIDAKEDRIRLTISRIHKPTSGPRLSMH